MQSSVPFGPNEQVGLISLFLDHPDLYHRASRFITQELFDRIDCKYIISAIKSDFDSHGVVPSRGILKDRLLRELTVEDPYEDILGLLARPSNPREVPFLKDSFLDWAKHQTFGLLYSEQAIDAHQRGDYEYLQKIVDQATSISSITHKGFWFFKQLDELFTIDTIDHISTGFVSLDKFLNEGGPSKGEVVVWLAPTGVGKCHSLQSKIIEKDLSRIFELELEDGKIVRLAGYRKIQTTRGEVSVCDLTEEDDIIEIPTTGDTGDISL